MQNPVFLFTMMLSNLAIQKAINNQWKDAININLQILADDFEDIDALNRLAQAYVQNGDISKGIEIYSKVVELDQSNSIALKNLSKLKNLDDDYKKICCSSGHKTLSLIEEPGKTKFVSLVRLGKPSIIAVLPSCLPLRLNIKNSSIVVYSNQDYIGKVPDDISKRVIWLIKRNNKYDAFVKESHKNKVIIFMREIKKSYLNKNHSSFI